MPNPMTDRLLKNLTPQKPGKKRGLELANIQRIERSRSSHSDVKITLHREVGSCLCYRFSADPRASNDGIQVPDIVRWYRNEIDRATDKIYAARKLDGPSGISREYWGGAG